MFNRLFSALENTRASISQAFRGISAGSITGEQLDNIEAVSYTHLTLPTNREV